MNTKLLYMDDSKLYKTTAIVQEVQGKTLLILEASNFYPQGGGQPFDVGEVVGVHGKFTVQEVRNIEGVVNHIGILEGEIRAGEEVICHIDVVRRELNSRNHSAGHVLDMAVHQAGFSWIPGKGYSFPDGPYVEYSGDVLTVDVQEVKVKIEAACQKIVSKDLPVTVEYMEREQMMGRVLNIPDHLPENRPARVVFMGDYGIPCGGTHVQSLKEIGQIGVRKIKLSGNVLRVSYQIG